MVRLEVFDTSGHLVRALGTLPSTGGASNLVFSAGALYADGTAKVLLSDANGGWSFAWDGTGADNGFVAPGIYLVRATYTEMGSGALAVKESPLTVSPVGDSIGRSLVAAPNPANGRRPMELRWNPSGRASLLRGRVYNMAGELVFLKAVDAFVGRLGWDMQSPQGLPLADGIYIWDVEVRDPQNRVIERIVRKVVILRLP